MFEIAPVGWGSIPILAHFSYPPVGTFNVSEIRRSAPFLFCCPGRAKMSTFEQAPRELAG
jgi:hypothetical protein